MKEIKYIITDPEGIHARPAGLLVNKSKEFKSNIQIKIGEKTADAKRIFGLMGLGVKKGDAILLTAEGEDEEYAKIQLEEFLKENL